MHREPRRVVLAGLLRAPRSTLLVRWNWKSALCSSLVRASLFAGIHLPAGPAQAMAAASTELVNRALPSGFHGALTQALSRAELVWIATPNTPHRCSRTSSGSRASSGASSQNHCACGHGEDAAGHNLAYMNLSRQPHARIATDDVMPCGDRLDWASRLRRLGLAHAERHGTSIQLWYPAPWHTEVRRWAAQEACASAEELFAELSGLG